MREESIGAEVVSWLRRHWLHLLLCPLIFLLFTVVHECAHVAAAWLQGATITDFSVFPSGNTLGYMNYEFPQGSNGSTELVSVAPYLLWGMCMSAAVLLSLRRSGYSLPIASSLFLWGFLGAWGDIALAGVSWLEAGRGDWAHVLGSGSTAPDALLLAFAGIIVLALGYGVQARLYRSGSLSKAGYAVLVAGGGLVLLVGASVFR
jgi:hypothetical protein